MPFFAGLVFTLITFFGTIGLYMVGVNMLKLGLSVQREDGQPKGDMTLRVLIFLTAGISAASVGGSLAVFIPMMLFGAF